MMNVELEDKNHSSAHILFVFILVSFQNLLDGPKHPLKSISLNGQQPAFCHTFDTSLSGSVSH